jgi:hypothetical protein
LRRAPKIRVRRARLGVLAHPRGVLILVTIQWYALVPSVLGRPTVWKGRDHLAARSIESRQ